MLDPFQKQLLLGSLDRLGPQSAETGRTLCGRLFELDASLRALCSCDAAEEAARRMMELIEMAIRSLDRWETSLPDVDRLGALYARRGARTGDYETLGSALLWTLSRHLRDCWTPELEDAWLDFYAQLSSCLEASAARHRG